jgi:hypothetical protein
MEPAKIAHNSSTLIQRIKLASKTLVILQPTKFTEVMVVALSALTFTTLAMTNAFRTVALNLLRSLK